MKNKIVVILITLTFLYCQQKDPYWIKKPPKSIYVGVSKIMQSEQEARIDAIKDAKRQIISFLGGIVETEFVDRMIEEGKSSEGSYTDSKVKIIAKNILSVETKDLYVKEIKIKKGLFKKETNYQVYAAVAFSKSAHERFLTELIEETEKVTRNRLQEVLTHVESGKLIFGINELKNLPDEYKNLLSITGLTPSQSAIIKQIDQDIKSHISEIQNNLHITTKKHEYYTKLGRNIKEPIEFFIFLDKFDKQVPVADIAVGFEIFNGQADCNLTAKSNENGIAKCNVNDIRSYKKLILRAKVDFDVTTGIKPVQHDVFLIPSNKISIKITENIESEKIEEPYLENILIQKFTEMNFQVLSIDALNAFSTGQIEQINLNSLTDVTTISNADFLIIGNIHIQRTSKYTDGIHFAFAKATIKLFDMEQNEIVESIIHEEKGAGNNDRSASLNAIKKASKKISKKIITRVTTK